MAIDRLTATTHTYAMKASLQVQIDADLKRQLKSAAALQGVELRDIVERLLREGLAREREAKSA